MDALISIYNGTITHWNDTTLTKLNPFLGQNLTTPSPIVPLHYVKENGATFILSSVFSSYSSWWKNNIGFGERVQFPSVGVVCLRCAYSLFRL